MFHYKDNQFYVEGVALAALAKKWGTPLYVYSQNVLEQNFRNYDAAFSHLPHIVCYALKANSSRSVARTFARLGAGADIVSGGELYRAIKAGFSPKKIVFSGVGKTQEEMAYALQQNILTFNIESLEELETLDRVAKRLKKKAPIAVRINPDVAAGGHHHITTGTAENKFGIHKKFLFEAYGLAKRLPNIEIKGIQAHIGSQITETQPFVTLLRVLLGLVDDLAAKGIPLENLDIGGGLGIIYKNEKPPHPKELAKKYDPLLKNRKLKLLFEPGRSLVGNAGVLLTQTLYRKNSGHKHFVIVDAAMNDLARPALYDAYHEIVPLEKKGTRKEVVDVVGPICESGDYLAKARKIQYPDPGDYYAVLSAGAYGFAMSSQYNSRPRVAEVLVKGRTATLIRKRENWQDIVRGER